MASRVEQLAANLWRWETPHPLWREGFGDDEGGWPRDVASLLYEREGTATIVDPQAVEDDDALWAFLDERAARAERVVVALTASWHRRDMAAVIERYGGEIRLHRIAAGAAVMQGVEGVRPFDVDGEVAPGVEALLIGGDAEGEVRARAARAGRPRRHPAGARAPAVDAPRLRRMTTPRPPPPRPPRAGDARAAARCSRTPGR
jgi:hypothetical protein